MIAISSHCPHDKSRETADNQIKALASWVNVFDKIFYLGLEPEPELSHERVSFLQSEDFPTIKHMIGIARMQQGPVAIINADIVLAPMIKSFDVEMAKEMVPSCLYSQRYQFDPANGIESGIVSDSGLDVFIALPGSWSAAYAYVPEYFRIGHVCFDGWLSGMFNRIGSGNFTNRRLVFHPIHKDRRQGYSIVHTDTEIDTNWAGIRHNYV